VHMDDGSGLLIGFLLAFFCSRGGLRYLLVFVCEKLRGHDLVF
jgi:hypothetical protein